MLISVNLPVFGSYIDEVAVGLFEREELRRGMVRALLAEVRIVPADGLATVNQTRPFSSNIGLCMLVWLSQIGSSPQYGDGAIGLSFEDGVFGSRTGIFTCVALCCDRVEDREEIRALLGRAVDRAVGVDRGIALVGRDLVVQVVLGPGPVPQRDDDVALDALRPRRLRAGSSPAAIRSVQSANSVKSALRVEPGRWLLAICVMACPDWMRRSHASAEDLNSPSSFGIVRVALLPSWWQVKQPLVLMTSQPLRLALQGLRHAVAVGPGAGELALVRNLEHRIPVDRRIVFRRRRRARRHAPPSG